MNRVGYSNYDLKFMKKIELGYGIDLKSYNINKTRLSHIEVLHNNSDLPYDLFEKFIVEFGKLYNTADILGIDFNKLNNILLSNSIKLANDKIDETISIIHFLLKAAAINNVDMDLFFENLKMHIEKLTKLEQNNNLNIKKLRYNLGLLSQCGLDKDILEKDFSLAYNSIYSNPSFIDAFVKECNNRNINTLEEAIEYLNTFEDDFNFAFIKLSDLISHDKANRTKICLDYIGNINSEFDKKYIKSNVSVRTRK